MELQEKYLTELQQRQLQIINHYGLDHQYIKLAEECAELIQALLKNDDSFQARIISEMSDVINLIEQIRLKDNFIDVGIETVKEYKVNRELDRIKKG